MPLATLPKEYVSGRDSYEWMMRKGEERSVFFQHIKNCQNLLPRVNPNKENMMNVQTKED